MNESIIASVLVERVYMLSSKLTVFCEYKELVKTCLSLLAKDGIVKIQRIASAEKAYTFSS